MQASYGHLISRAGNLEWSNPNHDVVLRSVNSQAIITPADLIKAGQGNGLFIAPALAHAMCMLAQLIWCADAINDAKYGDQLETVLGDLVGEALPDWRVAVVLGGQSGSNVYLHKNKVVIELARAR